MFFPSFCVRDGGPAFADGAGMIWFLEREADLLVCEIRRAQDDEQMFEFEIADAKGPKTFRFDSPRELIATYLGEQSRLMADGWHPRANIEALE